MDLANNKRQKLLYLVGAVTIGGLFFLVVHFIANLNRVTTDDAYIEGRIHMIASKIPGTVKEVRVNDNQVVKKGDLLLEIDPADYEVKVNEAQSALDAEKARLVDAHAGIKAALAVLEMKEASFKQAGLDKERAQALFKDGVIPKEKYEKILTSFDLALAETKAVREQVAKANSLKELEESLIKQREAMLKSAQLNLGYTKIAAPSGGHVTRKSVERGNQIQAGQPLMAVIALDDIWIIANYKETQLKSVQPGQRVIIKVDTYSGRVFSGKVDSIMAGTGAAFSLFPPENALGNYVKVVQRVPVKVVFDNLKDDHQVLRIGMSCILTIITKDE